MPPVNRDVPYVSGTGVVGTILNCTMGNWENEPTAYAYQWHGDGTALAGASGADYVVAESDLGHALTCVVTATNADGQAAAPPSNPVTAVEPPKAHDPVAAGGKCAVEGCGWEWGSADPHPVHISPQNVHVPIEATPAPPPAPQPVPPDPKGCAPIAMQAKCPKCDWTAESGNPHPVF